MKRRSSVLVPVAALLAGVTATTAQGAGPPSAYRPIAGVSPEPIAGDAGVKSKEDLEAFIDGVMAAHLRQNHLAGAMVAVVKDGGLFFEKGYGYADAAKRTPVDPKSTMFRPGSVSKMFTWTAVMQLVEQGRLNLDVDVNTYLTQFKLPATFEAPITLRNIMTHTPGFEDGGVGFLFVRTPAELKPLAEALSAHIPARVRPPTTDFSDGTNSSYSNFATALAGLIVANVSGMSFDDYLDRNILAPLGMTGSTSRQPLPATLADKMATGHTFKNGAWEPSKTGFEIIPFAPAGSMSANASDMAKFMIAHLNLGEYNGQRILKEESARLMQSRQLSPHPHVNGSGLGFYETWVNGRRMIGHSGDTLYFHTEMALLPEAGLGLYLSYNTTHEAGSSIARRDLVRAFMDRYYPAVLPKVTPPADVKDRAAQYAGSYSPIRHSYTKIERMFGLLGAVTVVPTKHNTLLLSGGVEVTEWVGVAPGVFRRTDKDDTMAFVAGRDGRITHMVGPFTFIPSYKLAWYQAPSFHYLIFGMGLLCFVISIVSALRHRKADRSAEPTARRARRLAALVGVLHFGFLLLLVGSIAGGIDDLLFGFPSAIKVALVLPLLAIPLTLGVVYLAVVAWKRSYWTRYGRVQYSVVALFSMLFLWSLNFWNLIGYKFG